MCRKLILSTLLVSMFAVCVTAQVQVVVFSDDFERKLNRVVQEQADLAQNIQKLEEDYDNEIFNSEMGDLKDWLEQQGVRLD